MRSFILGLACGLGGSAALWAGCGQETKHDRQTRAYVAEIDTLRGQTEGLKTALENSQRWGAGYEREAGLMRSNWHEAAKRAHQLGTRLDALEHFFFEPIYVRPREVKHERCCGK